jgi:hypothetical protein
MEAHYKIMFSAIENPDYSPGAEDDEDHKKMQNSFKIDEIRVDVVYGTANDARCDGDDYTLKTSLTWL